MKRTYEKPGFKLSIFESKDPISARGDWELGFSKKSILDPYRDIDEEHGSYDGNGDGGLDYAVSGADSEWGY